MLKNRNRIIPALALCSCAVLLTEITLTRIFSVTLMYHYGFLVLSITIFGLGAGGIFHFVSDVLRKRPQSPAWLALASAAALPLCLGLIFRLSFSPQIFSPGNLGALLAIILLSSIPFFFAGLFISLVYILHRGDIPTLYASDLLGAAGGCILAVVLIGALGAPQTPLVASLLLIISALLAAQPERKRWFGLCFLMVLAGIALLPFTNWLKLSFVKGETESQLDFQKWNAFSRVAVSRFGDRRVIHIDAGAATEVAGSDALKTGLDAVAGMARLPYLIRRNSKALIIGPGGGREIASALAAANTVTGVEINPIIVQDLMLGKYADYSGHIYSSPGVRIVTADARSYLERTGDRYAVIQENGVDTWAAVSGGGYTLSESYLYTVEAFETYFRHLDQDGVLAIGRWTFKKPQQMIRIISLALQAMDRQCPGDYRRRFFLVSDQSYEQGGGVPGVLLIKKEPFTDYELSTLRTASSLSHYRVLYDPAAGSSSNYAELITSMDRGAFFDHYPLDIRPPSDDKPFFFFTLRWKDVVSVWNTPEESRKNNAGLFLLAGAFVIMLVLTTATFVIPMLMRRRNRIRASAGFYFVFIGLAFMMAETVLIQRGTLFLGHPTYSFPTVLCALLVGAGTGSWLTTHVRSPNSTLSLIRPVVLLAVVMSIILLLLPLWLRGGFHLPLYLRVVWLSFPVFGLGLVLGRLFPMGLRRLDDNEIPWAWALNGSASVLGSITAVLLGMRFGFSAVLWQAFALYCLAGVSAAYWDTRSRDIDA